jgi:hypothetical protein
MTFSLDSDTVENLYLNSSGLWTLPRLLDYPAHTRRRAAVSAVCVPRGHVIRPDVQMDSPRRAREDSQHQRPPAPPAPLVAPGPVT